MWCEIKFTLENIQKINVTTQYLQICTNNVSLYRIRTETVINDLEGLIVQEAMTVMPREIVAPGKDVLTWGF